MLLRIGRVRSRVRWAKALATAATSAFWVLPSLAQTGAGGPAASTAPLRVTLNHAGVVTFDGSAATALIADPNVADIVTERGNVLFILGRSIGTTNLLVYDGSGHRLVEREVVVVPDEVGVVTVTRDIYENDYFCTPRCVSPPPPTPLAGASASAAPAARAQQRAVAVQRTSGRRTLGAVGAGDLRHPMSEAPKTPPAATEEAALPDRAGAPRRLRSRGFPVELPEFEQRMVDQDGRACSSTPRAAAGTKPSPPRNSRRRLSG